MVPWRHSVSGDVGPELSVVADPTVLPNDTRELIALETEKVFADVVAFLDIRCTDVNGDAVRIDDDQLEGFRGRQVDPAAREQPASRLLNVAVAWQQGCQPREIQLLEVAGGGLWVVAAVGRPDGTDDLGLDPRPSVLDLIPDNLGRAGRAPIRDACPRSTDVSIGHYVRWFDGCCRALVPQSFCGLRRRI